MMDMNFRHWFLNEAGTSTSSVAVFSRPIFGNLVSRKWTQSIGFKEYEPEKKSKKKSENNLLDLR
jgi:hypothetical protein